MKYRQKPKPICRKRFRSNMRVNMAGMRNRQYRQHKRAVFIRSM